MRRLNLDLDWGRDCDFFEQVRIIKEVGFDGTFLQWQSDKKEFMAVAEECRRVGLFIQSVHAPFTNSYTLWEEGEAGDKEVEVLKTCIDYTAEIGCEIVVMHAIIGFDRHTPNNIGLERFRDILLYGKSKGVKVALENTEGLEYVEYLFKNLPEDLAYFNIDTGHEMCYNYSKDLITKFKNRLIATHLNDNMGITGSEITWLDDAHMLPFDGIADWDKIADRLVNAGYKGDLTFELIMANRPDRHTHDKFIGMTFKEFCTLTFERAVRFREIVELKEKTLKNI